jgi:tetratricopeptide (TPR) repeat protein
LAFSSDGKTLASVSLKGEIILWDLDPQEWIKQSCQRSGSSFTYAEWERYFPNEEYRATCPQWPLDFESIKTIAQNALSNADDPNQVKTALDKVQAELAKNDAIQYLFTESHNIVSVAIVENILEFVATGDTKTALDLFGQAKQMQVQISVDDKIEFYKTIAEVVLSNSDDPNRLSTAFDGVNMALEIDGTVKDPGTEALNIINDTTLKQISVEAVPHDIKKALDLFEQANQMQINITITDTNVLNDLCWFGSLQGYAKQALQHCEAAVKLAPDVGYIRDSRGLAYALAGDYQGAILDFQYYVDSNSADSDTVQQRKQWIEQLKKGINPFTSDVLESLNSQ